MEDRSQFVLLTKRRFGPFFTTQFLGAFNDNLFKNALIVMLAFQATDTLGLSSNTLINLAAGLFILPFFLFSASFGQLADKLEKSRLIRLTKLLEMGIMLGAAVGFYQRQRVDKLKAESAWPHSHFQFLQQARLYTGRLGIPNQRVSQNVILYGCKCRTLS